MKRILHIDIETFCNYDVGDVGVYRYAEDPSFKIILFAWRWGDGPVRVLDTYNDAYPGASIPADVMAALTADDSYIAAHYEDGLEIWAHNANFEMVGISTYYGIQLNPRAWYCTMVAAAYLGLPLGLDKLGQVLRLSEQKDSKGKALISFFCGPVKLFGPKPANGGPKPFTWTVNLPKDHPEKWRAFKGYNGQDVRVECEVHSYILKFPGLPDFEREYWIQDQEINARGVFLDRQFIDAAIVSNQQFLAQVHQEMVDLAGIDNPNSPPQLKRWINDQLDAPIASLNKDYLKDSVDTSLLPANVARLLELRALGSKTSISKYDKMVAYACSDNRIRGLFQYYGANRTGRYAGRGVQLQNLKKTSTDIKKVIKEAAVKGVTYSPEKIRKLRGDSLAQPGALVTAKAAVTQGIAELLYDDVPEVISKLVRTALVAAPGKTLCISDFAAIEARVLAWIAGEEWVLDIFKTHGKIYEATAANMFNVPFESVTKGSALRDKGKVATLALGYQGASGAMITMGALREGLTEAELPAIVQAWRAANPKIVKLWRDVEAAARHVISKRTSYTLIRPYCSIKFTYERGYMFIELPSGRRLAYYGAHIEDGRKIRYWGLDQVKKIWVKMDAYGGLLVENITQAIARDCLTDAMFRMKLNKELIIFIIMHIHDEIVAEAPDALANDVLKEMNNIMSVSPLWAKGLPLEGDGFITKYYKKDG